MKPVAVIASGAVSALGRGATAYDVGRAGEPARSAVARDPELEAWGLRRPFSARVAEALAPEADRAAEFLAVALRDLVAELDRLLPEWRGKRVGVCLGTSAGGLCSLERLLTARFHEPAAALEPDLAARSFYAGPLALFTQELSLALTEQALVLSACSSSTVALGLSARWLAAGHVDLAIAGGFDALSRFVCAGFEALGATASGPPQPFRLHRDGMVLGEGAALVALTRAEDAPSTPFGYVLGFGASSDAVHVTAPDRTGAGLCRAARAALRDANTDSAEIDLVSAHATATPYNDAAEANALAQLFGAASERCVVHPFKAAVGHTLGASGALESLAALSAMQRSLFPAAPGSGPIEPNFRARLLSSSTPGQPGFCLKLSSAFGGANAALVLGKRRPQRSPRSELRRVYLRAVGRARHELDDERTSQRWGIDPLRLSRLDPISRLAVAACDAVLETLDTRLPDGAGVIIGTGTATLELDASYEERLLARGVRGAEPRRFPPTSPNLAAGECSILFGLHGPAFSVGAGPDAGLEALLVAHDLLEAGDASALLVVALEHVGPFTRELHETLGRPVPSAGAVAVLLEAGTEAEAAPLRREDLSRLRHEAKAGSGRLRGAEPGWPSLLAALSDLGVAAPLTGSEAP